MLEQGIAMAFLPPSVEIGDVVQIEARSDTLDGTVVSMPFFIRDS
jgi:small-conductance mechanosensitive channel